jgi:hypothetical protein
MFLTVAVSAWRALTGWMVDDDHRTVKVTSCVGDGERHAEGEVRGRQGEEL